MTVIRPCQVGLSRCITSTANAGGNTVVARKRALPGSWLRHAGTILALLACCVFQVQAQAATCTINPQNPTINTGGSVNWSASFTGFSRTPRYNWTFQGGNPGSSTSASRTVSYAGAGTFTTSLSLSRGGNATCTTTVTVNAPDSQAPTTPQNLNATAASSSRIDLAWNASADNVGVTGYRVYSCTGTSCTPTTQIATTPTNSYSNTGLTPNTTYRYRVRAEDAAGNLSNFSGTATASTQSPVLPGITISNVTVTEGQTANFVVSLSASSAQTVTVVASTANGTATAPGDYTARSNVTLTFSPGTLTQTFSVTTVDDTTVESTETFNVNLGNATNATIADSQGVASILDNDQAQTVSLSINDVTVVEGQAANFTVSLSAASTQTVTVVASTANGTAQAPADYTARNNVTLTFSPGTLTQTFAVTTIDDTQVEGTETFSVNLSNAGNATISDNQGAGTINDNDGSTPNTSINSTSQSSIGRVTGVVSQQTQVPNSSYSVLAINDLGMHCGDLDTRIASILPPFQVLLSQVVQKGSTPTLNPAGVTLAYSAAANPNDPILTQSGALNGVAADGSTYKTNFWDAVRAGTYDPFYPAYNPLQGPSATLTPLAGPPFNVSEDTGLPVPNVEKFYIGSDGQLGGSDVTLEAVLHAMPGINNPYSGNIPQLVQEHYTNKPFFTNFPFGYVAANVNWFEGAGVPFAAFDDYGRENAYPLVRVQARNAGGTVLSTVDTVLPISGEASCTNCHTANSDYQGTHGVPNRTDIPTQALSTAGLPVALSLDDPESNMPPKVSLEYAADINILRLHDLKHGARYVSTACTSGNCLSSAADPCSISSGNPNGSSSCLTNKALVQGKPVVCQVCHYTPALDLAQHGPLAGAPGTVANGRNQLGHESNSRVMHNHHGTITAVDRNGVAMFPAIPAPTQNSSGLVTNQSTRLAALENSCYQCHPGKDTRCLRGAMFNGDMLCSDCHGSMQQVGDDFSRNVSPGNAGAFILANNFYTNASTPRVPWANEPGCGSCHTGDAVSSLAGTAGMVVNTRDSNGRLDGLRLRQAFRTGDARATPIVPTNKRFAEPAVPASFNGTANPGAGNPQLYRVSAGHKGVMCEGCHGATHAEWPNANPNANDNVTANQLQGHSGFISDCKTCHNTTNPGNSLDGPHGLHPIDTNTTPWSSSSNHRSLGSNYTANCQACHGGTSRGSSCGTPLSRALNDRTFSGRSIAKGQPVGCAVCHNSSYWNSTCANQ